LGIGTSLHPAKSHCQLALLKIYEKYQFYRLLDLGTGTTGILAIDAALLGTERGFAVDITVILWQ
jgi:ribosomal protein L11 methylase PrmA